MDDPMNTEDSSQEDTIDGTKLSIVVQARVEDDQTPRVWLLYENQGNSLVIATSAESPYELIQETAVPTLAEDDAIREKGLGAEARTRFEDAMQRISDVSDAGLEIWTPLRTSEAFAAGIWEAALGEKLPHTIFGQSSPQKLAQSISAANAHDLGMSQDIEERIELPLTPRERGLEPEQDDQDQGLSL